MNDPSLGFPDSSTSSTDMPRGVTEPPTGNIFNVKVVPDLLFHFLIGLPMPRAKSSTSTPARFAAIK